jgi:hypothetical protein
MKAGLKKVFTDAELKIKHAILLPLLIVIGSSAIYACQPVIQKHSKYFRRADAVFVGTPTDISSNDISRDSDEREYYPYKIKFRVEKSWKGNSSEITVVSDNGKGPCGQVTFKIGEKYLVYAFGKNLRVTTYVGNRSRPLNGVSNDVWKKELAELDNFWFRLKSGLWFF